MARLNSVTLYGIVASDPLVTYNEETGRPTKATLYVLVANQNRENGIIEDEMFFSKPLVYTMDPVIVEQIAGLHQYDMVYIKGMITVLNANRGSTCPHCGKKIVERAEISFVTPLFVDCRYSGLTYKEATEKIREYREVSNQVYLLGNLCADVTYKKQASIYQDIISRSSYRGISSYQIGVTRKYFLSADNPANKSDYPHIVSVGSRAEMDAKCIHKGSLVLVDGMIVTRSFRLTDTCPECGNTFDWPKSVMEVLTFGTEYLDNFITPEEYEAQQKEKLEELKAGLGFTKKQEG